MKITIIKTTKALQTLKGIQEKMHEQKADTEYLLQMHRHTIPIPLPTKTEL